MKEESKFVDVHNDFYNEKLTELIELLDSGEIVTPVVNCIGHTRHNMTQESYKSALIKHYGEKLKILVNNGVYCYTYTYEVEK